jgi:exosortase/archaeosortase family protein
MGTLARATRPPDLEPSIPPPPLARPVWQALGIFLITFFGLQQGWSMARGTRLEHWVIDCATVGTSVALINVLTPGLSAVARGPSIVAPGGGIDVINGCEGTELWFLLAAALLAYPFSASSRLLGLVTGVIFTFLINQLRLLALFYSFRDDRAVFEQLHGILAPLGLIAGMLIFFRALLEWEWRRVDGARG